LQFIRSTLWAVRVCTNPVSRLLFFVGCLSPGPRKNDLTNYWALGLFVRSNSLVIEAHQVPARTTTQLVSLVLVTIEFDHKRNEKEKKQSKRKSSNEHNKSLSLITKALCGVGRGFDLFGVSCIECYSFCKV
jgi:hypothetical protein